MRCRNIVVLTALVGAFAAQAADWRPVAAAGGDRIELDKDRIVRIGDGKSLAWTRLTSDRELSDADGAYTAILALNRYDCVGRSFVTLKRVYLRADRVVREEEVSFPRLLSAAAGATDERVLAEVCKPRTAKEARQAEAAARQAESAGKPGVMYADMRTAEGAPQVKTVPVVEATPVPVTKAPEKPADKAADKSADKPAAARPRFIELPPIDKSKLEDPYAGTAKPGDAKPAGTKPAEAKPGEAKAAAKPDSRVAAATAKAAEAARAAETAGAGLSRNQLERQYATSGPRHSAPRRKPQPAAAIVVPTEPKIVHWSYEGEGGPANWGKLRPDFATCATGKRQSPIDIHDGIRVDLEPIAFDYHPSLVRITDTGHTIQVAVGEGSSFGLTGKTYRLVQFHFHRPAEDKVNGKSYDMELHLVHQDDEGHTAVVAVFLEKSAENPVIQGLWNNLPLEVDQPVEPPNLRVDPAALLPQQQTYYTYMGSLTTPPCTEEVLWLVMKQPIQVSAEQIAIFSRLYRNNARPVQPGNNRLIKENR